MRVTVRLQPRARRSAVGGVAELGDGTAVLKAMVGEPPEGGKANAALIKLLAKAWKLPKSAIRIVAGQSSRQKTLLIAGDPEELRERLELWLAGRERGPSR